MNPTAPTLLSDSRCRLGESPVWDAASGALWWCDSLAGEVLRVPLAGGEVRRWRLGETVGSLGLARAGGLVVAVENAVVHFDPESGRARPLARTEPAVAGVRLNDGKVGPDGAFWVGSMDGREAKEPLAALYRVAPDGTCERKLDGLTVSNGLAWSADGRTMLHSDSRGGWIDAWDFDAATGAIANRRRLASVTPEEGRPDGGALDRDGVYWSAGVSAGCLNRFALADGRLLSKIPAGVPAPTMVCFAGEDLRTLVVTSLRWWLDEAALEAHPTSGGVLTMRAEVEGVPVGLFG